MGFGKKTDYPTGRVLDLDKSYNYIIKPAAEAAGLECKRADEIIHSGLIDVPMYEQLLKADVVVADVSTYNCNAFYELGVRHALRPFTTITISEDKMTFPFDVNHLAIRRYQHLGEGIDYGEVQRMQKELRQAIEWVAKRPSDDSPVYTFLKGLKPPAIEDSFTPPSPPPDPANNPTVSVLMDQANAALDKSDFATAKALFAAVRAIMPADPYVAQKLALATYKLGALAEARQILLTLQPDVSTDTETLGLWGAVHKRLWDATKTMEHLDTAVASYEKGFYLKNDYYNGINLAYLLNLRSSAANEPADAIADFVMAQRIRRQVIKLCDALLAGTVLPAERYWIYATLAEAHFGLGNKIQAQSYLDRAFKETTVQWMKDTTAQQLARLDALLSDSPLERIR